MVGKFPGPECFDLVVDEPARILKPDGSLLAVLARPGLMAPAATRMYLAIHGKVPQSDNRGLASGSKRFHQILLDGTVSRTNRAKTAHSGIMGFFERYPRIPYCRAAALNGGGDWLNVYRPSRKPADCLKR